MATNRAKTMERASNAWASESVSAVTYVTGYDDRALPCHTADPELFFSEELNEMAAAKSLCAACPVARTCLEGAIARSEPWGIWGGQLFDNGKPVAAKRRAGRPRIHNLDESRTAQPLLQSDQRLRVSAESSEEELADVLERAS